MLKLKSVCIHDKYTQKSLEELNSAGYSFKSTFKSRRQKAKNILLKAAAVSKFRSTPKFTPGCLSQRLIASNFAKNIANKRTIK